LISIALALNESREGEGGRCAFVKKALDGGIGFD
jgi:hypothetical protein